MPDSILIVHGCPARRIALRQKLKAEYSRVLTASSGNEALELAMASQPAVILADTNLPDMSKEDFCHAIRELPDMNATPILLIEASPDSSAIQSAFAAGADDVISANVGSTYLASVVLSFIRRRQKRAALGQRVAAAGLSVPEEGSASEAALLKTLDTAARIWLASGDPDRAAALTHDLSRAMPLSHFEPFTIAEARRSIAEQFEADIVILDVSDLDLRRALLEISEMKARLSFCHGEVIVMTAREEVETAAIALDLGAVMSVPTDIAAPVLATRIASVLKNKHQSALNWQHIDRSLRLAAFDPLTGLMNRRAGLFGLERMLDDSLRRGLPMALLAVDLDGFKEVNDRYGHSVGDMVLGQVSIRMAAILPRDALCARTGGDEFVIALPATSHFDAALFSAQLQDAVAGQPIDLPGDIEIQPRLSIGVVQTGTDGADTVAALLRAADKRLYRDKARTKLKVSPSRPARAA